MTIELQHIDKRFGSVHANRDISVTFMPGRIYGILGENGAGKSTLMKILAGYQPPDSGQIMLDGSPIPPDPQAALARGIGMLQQDPLDVGAFTVLENFVYGMQSGLLYQRRTLKDARKSLSALATRFEFDLDPDTPVERLSIPQRQQLEIVRLLALGVRVLILDEPTTGIAADQKETLFNALRELARDDRMTILLVSHKLEDVIALCDEVIVLRSGQLVGQRVMPATTQELVAMMFGGALPEQERPHVPLGNPILKIDRLTTAGR
ncbi:MAG: ATP-binding cassette domain-containing protein, partial [Anaerolinea sp.]